MPGLMIKLPRVARNMIPAGLGGPSSHHNPVYHPLMRRGEVDWEGDGTVPVQKYPVGKLRDPALVPPACLAASRTAFLAHRHHAVSRVPVGHATLFSLKMMIWQPHTTSRSHSSLPSPFPSCFWSLYGLG